MNGSKKSNARKLIASLLFVRAAAFVYTYEYRRFSLSLQAKIYYFFLYFSLFVFYRIKKRKETLFHRVFLSNNVMDVASLFSYA